ncbi:hypothetical protein JD844_032808 [Phrynosoma platyrhinos]|uniref:Transposase Helix-turn-helix domain-containing protein n=1 Tax=Phrynosoma platyrhinos TaxID=52577 RepID=A0ABQ7T5P6_PHRPL|nr:hypothetical protein JD844_032808 [Phrynosoma platyrhinos]
MRKTWQRRLILLKSALKVDEDVAVAVDDGTIDWHMRQNDDNDDLNSFSYVGEVTWAMPVEKQVAIAVYFLVHKGSYATIATIFDVGKSTVCKAIIRVIAMELVLLKKTVYLGNYRKV